MLDTIRPTLLTLSTTYLNYDRAEELIRQMKREFNLAPSTIRHRGGTCALRRPDGAKARRDHRAAPLRLVKRGFVTYSDEDRHHLACKGKEGKRDIERDRRLDADEEVRILEVLMLHIPPR